MLSAGLRNFVIIILAVFLAGFDLYAQSAKKGFEHLTMEQGLSSNTVVDILIDHKGYLWAATIHGLDRYDGYDFTSYHFNPRDAGSINENYTLTLYEDREGTIWVGTVEGGISRYDHSTEKFFNYKPVQPVNRYEPVLRSVSVIAEDARGIFWVGSYSGELRTFNKQTGLFSSEDFDLGYQPQKNDLRPFDRINSIYKDHSGDLWVGNRTGLHKLIISKDNRGKEVTGFKHFFHSNGDANSLSGTEVNSIKEDSQGNLWIGTDSGLNKMVKGREGFVHYFQNPLQTNSLGNNFIAKLIVDSLDNLWISTGSGLDYFDQHHSGFEHFNHDPNDENSINDAGSLAIDKSGNLWIGGNGIDKLDARQTLMVRYRHETADKNSLASSTVNRIFQDRKGGLWFLTDNGMDLFNKQTGIFQHYTHDPKNSASIAENHVGGMVEDSAGNIWVTSFFGSMDKWDRKSGKFIHYIGENGLIKNATRLIFNLLFIDNKSILWIGAGSGGVIRFDSKTGNLKRYIHDPSDASGLSDYETRSLAQDKKGNLWIGHGSVATDRLNPETGIIKHYQYNFKDTSSISSNVVNKIYRDSKSRLWFATVGGGLCRYNDSTDTFTSYTEKDGLINNDVNSIVEDNDGNLWLGTAKGISRLSISDMVFKTFNFLNSAKIDQEVVFLFRDRDGALYFKNGDNGVFSFDPHSVRPNLYIPPVVITRFKLFSELKPGFNEASEIKLDHDSNFFSFEFAALNYTNPENNQYAYKLEGVDKDWVYSGTTRTANYTGVPPGDYTFMVKASNNEGKWNNTGTSIKIKIYPPWWRTWWAYTIFALLFLAAVWGFIYYRSNRLRQENLILEKKVENRTIQLNLSLEELKATQSQLIQSEKMASLGELTAGIAHEIQNPLNFVNNFSELNNELIDEMNGELDKGDLAEAKAIAADIGQNLQKIHQHGKRADSIVKGMLQHSTSGTGIKEPTDINILAEEYLRLSYQRYRAKEKDFFVSLERNYDQSIDKMNIIPQDMGRVMINLYNNAFYFVSEKKKHIPEGYEPVISITTKKTGDKVVISVKDNGKGIEPKIQDKIFQPFFTTKPTGQGTGLGLSLSYDIIKAHGGEIKINTKQGEYSEFIISLPSGVVV